MEGHTIATDDISVNFLMNGTERKAEQAPRPPVSVTTSSTSAEYRHRLADISSRAIGSDPLNLLFEQEKDPSVTTLTSEMMYKTSLVRIDSKVGGGAIIVEAANFAAMACWEPPSATPALFSDEQLEILDQERPVFAQFMRDIQSARLECLGAEQKYWGLSLMARDPDRTDKGVVRAVIETYVKQAKREGMPLWLTAGNARARKVYEYFGFRVVRVIQSSRRKPDAEDEDEDEDEGVVSWSMVCNWPPE